MQYELTLKQFSGPLEKLLELIEARELPVAEVSLAEVTGDFLRYLERLEGKATPDLIADFAVIAAQLILIKSKSLIPELALTEEEEGDIRDLEGRLALYREFKKASAHLKEAWPDGPQMHARQFLAALSERGMFYPPSRLTAEMLLLCARHLTASLAQFTPETARVKSIVVSLETRIQDLLRRFSETATHRWSSLARERPRGEVIVLFLAVLHLLKNQAVTAEQQERFGDIIIQKL